jgi:hypothetical protein
VEEKMNRLFRSIFLVLLWIGVNCGCAHKANNSSLEKSPDLVWLQSVGVRADKGDPSATTFKNECGLQTFTIEQYRSWTKKTKEIFSSKSELYLNAKDFAMDLVMLECIFKANYGSYDVFKKSVDKLFDDWKKEIAQLLKESETIPSSMY